MILNFIKEHLEVVKTLEGLEREHTTGQILSEKFFS